MESFISREQLARTEKQARVSAWILRILAAGMLVLFVVLCLVTRTANARTILRIMFISMTLLGWIWIGLRVCVERPAKAQARHLATMLSGEPEEYEGILEMSARPVRIPKSVRVRRVTLTGEENPNPAEEPARKRLNLDERLADRMPPDGSRIRVQAVHSYITGLEVLAEGGGTPGEDSRRGDSRIRTAWRRVSLMIIPFILWTMAVVILGGFVFSLVTDTDAEHKIMIYADCDVRDSAGLADMLERKLADPIRMVKVRPFDYDLFGIADIRKADMYIVTAAKAESLRSWLVPLPEAFRDEEDLLILDGEPYGIPVCRPDSADRVAASFFAYDSAETYYLVFSAASLHLSGNDGAADNRAAEAAEELLAIP